MNIQTPVGTAPLLRSDEQGVSTLVLNRPDARNALDPELAGALAAAIRAASDDPSARVIVLTGAGSAFCAGARLDALLAGIEQGDPAAVGAAFGVVHDVYRALLDARPPTIAMVNGYALAGGCGIATACDLVVASERAEFGYPEVHLGLMPGMVMAFLFRLVGFRAGLELALTGRRIPAEEAARLGLINRVMAHDELEASVGELAEQLAGLSPTALAQIKRWAWALPGQELSRALDQGRDVSTLCAMSPEAREGIARFLEKRDQG